MGRSSRAAFADISSTMRHEISSSVASGKLAASSRMRGFQTAISFLSTETAIEGLQVAPTAPCSMEYVSSSIAAESFQRQVGGVCVILKSGVLNGSAESTGAMHPPFNANVCNQNLSPVKLTVKVI